MVNFMRSAVNEQRKYKGLPALTASEFLKLMRQKREVVELDSKLANRSVNEGFSGGEKKRNEIFQMKPFGKRRLFGRGKETERDIPNGNAGTEVKHFGRNRFGIGY